MEKGILKIGNKGRRELKLGKKKPSIPKEFDTAHLEKGSYDCVVIIEQNKLLKILINGKELPKIQAIVKHKAAQKENKIAVEKAAKEALELEKKYAPIFKNDLFKAYQEEDNGVYQMFVPKDSSKHKFAAYQAENFALKLNKFAIKEDKFIFFRNDKKNKQLRQTIAFFENFPFEGLVNRHQKLVQALCSNLQSWNQVTDGRMVVGLGTASVYETSMTLHHIYGIPYIPASSIKGLLRSWILVNSFNASEDKEAEKRAMKDPVFLAFFGSDENALDKKAHQGQIIFFDAFPTEIPKVEVDIMTPHYGDWYTAKDADKAPPTDSQKPTPIPFLTIAKTSFQFILGERGNQAILKKELEGKTILQWLQEALSEHGIGAKTAVGYGYFKEIDSSFL